MKTLHAALAVAASCALAPAAYGQSYPARPVHVIIPITAGTATDIVGRVVTQKLSDFWGRQVVVENRAGAGTSIGTAAVAKAAPDGYTLLINSSAHTVNPAIYAKLPYDTLRDFIDVAPLVGAPNVLVVNPSSNIRTVADFIAAAKARPGEINVGSAGVGTGTHLNLEKFKLMAGINVTHIPYKGTPEVVSDIMGDRVTSYFAPIAAAITLIQGGKLRAVAVSSARRSSQLPDVPTIAESGVPGFDFTLWFGLWVPAGTPADIVNKLAADTARALAQSDVREQLAKLGNDPMSMTPAQFSQYVRSEIEDSMRIVKAAGIEPQ
jgi:tripartite-type tricarboxylate transporter receptor subunit TctC